MRAFSPRSWPIRLRVALSFALFLVVVVAIIGTYLLTFLENNLLREADETLALRADHIRSRIVPVGQEQLSLSGVSSALQAMAPEEEFSTPGIYAMVFDDKGKAVSSSPNLPGGWIPVRHDQVDKALAGQDVYVTIPVDGERVRVLAQPLRSGDQVVGVLVVGESLHMLDRALRRMFQLLLFAGATAVVVGLLGGWWLTARALGPVAEVTRVARRIAATGEFDRRLAAPPAEDELGELTATFNEMLARLERTFRRQREFIADASHELRGPLMVIRGNLDLLKMDLSPEDRRQSASEAAEEVDRMSHLVSDLLFLSEVDAQETLRRQPVALHEVVADIIAKAKEVDAGQHQVQVPQNDPCLVEGDQDRLLQMLRNLVENALRYTPAGGTISVALRRHGPVAELTVADTGIGIPAEHLPRVFERFYRVDKARSRAQGGSGLGLAIVKQIAEAHGGQVRVRSEPGTGSVFTVVLPTLAQPEPSAAPRQ